MYRSQTLALKYFAAAITFFGVMTITGLLSSYYYINPDFLFGILPFNIMKILHINTLVIWLLMGFMGSIYWFLPGELGRETAGIRAAEILFYVFCAAVAVVAVVFIFVQIRRQQRGGSVVDQSGPEVRRSAALGCPRHRRDHGGIRLQRDRNRDRCAQDHRDHHRIDDRPGATHAALPDRISGDHQHVGGTFLVVVARPTLGRAPGRS